MNSLVSIIVPVYNTPGHLLTKCVESLVNQSYDNIEIILVDDGSAHNTAFYCDELAKTDHRISAIHKENGGLSSARNAGLDAAKGDYISFVDSDDYLGNKSISKMLRAQISSKCPIVCMRSIIFDENGKTLFHFGNDSDAVTRSDWADYLRGICEKRLSESVCDKLFIRDLFKNKCFEEGRLNEDFLFLSNMLMTERPNIALLDYAGYHYFKHSGTITADRGNFASLKDAIKNSCQLAKIAKNGQSEAYHSFVYSALFQTRVLMTSLPTDKINSDDWIFCLDVINRFKSEVSHCNLRKFDRILLYGYEHAPHLTKAIYNIIKHRAPNFGRRNQHH